MGRMPSTKEKEIEEYVDRFITEVIEYDSIVN